MESRNGWRPLPEITRLPEPAIRAEGLTKTYRYTEQSPGLTGALKDLFRPDRRERLAVDALELASAGSSPS